MDKNAIKKYAVWARRELIERVSQRAMIYGITAKDAGDPNAESVNGHLLSQAEKRQRQALIRNIKTKGYEQVMEEVAYTWFNRFAALRFMEVNGYLPSHIRVFTNDAGEFKPQILAEAIHLELEGLDMNKVYELESANKSEKLFKYLLIVQCNALNSILPGMFQRIEDYTELLLPDYLLREGSVIEQMVTTIPEEDWTDQVQIIGWLYQFYIAEPKDALINARSQYKVQDIPLVTQLFTPDWIVHFMVENSLGRLWLEGHPNDVLKSEWKYYLDDTEKDKNAQNQLAIFQKEYAALKPEEIRVIDPCMGSGHILCVLFDVLVRIYEDYGYTAREAAVKIVENNLWGLDIDERATQLSYFAVMMKARQYDRRFFTRKVQPHVYAFVDSNLLSYEQIEMLGKSLDTSDRKEAIHEVTRLANELRDATVFGSILEVTPCNWGLLNRYVEDREEKGQLSLQTFEEIEARKTIQQLIRIGIALSQQYTSVVTNPPYMATKYMPDVLKKHVISNYPELKSDLFAVFVKRCHELCMNYGQMGFLTPYVWMFIQSYEEMRKYVFSNMTMSALIQLEYNAFEAACVPVATFTLRNYHSPHPFECIKLSDFKGVDLQEPKTLEAINNRNCGYRYTASQENFGRIPGEPVAYWVSQAVFDTFNQPPIQIVCSQKTRISTGDNDRFMRKWYEIESTKMMYPRKWVPCPKGGDYRKWYGNVDLVLNWENDGEELKAFPRAMLGDKNYFMKPGLTWTVISSTKTGFRVVPAGSICDHKGPLIYITDARDTNRVLGLLNSKFSEELLKVTAPTIGFEWGAIAKTPWIGETKYDEEINQLVADNIRLSKADWDSFETSWDFSMHPFVRISSEEKINLLEDVFDRWNEECSRRFNQLRENEERLNEIVIDIFGLEQEMGSDVADEDVTVRKADLTRDIRSFISYSVGCMFGRYSLNHTGIAYAGGPWNKDRYTVFSPDADGIIPICDDDYFEDDVVGRLIRFVETVFGKERLEENLRFIAKAIGGKGTSREAIRNYFITDFYKDHCKIYQKRPIYWMFDSGRKNGFKCIIYIHRYRPDTIARIRTDYVHEQQSRYRTAIADLEQRINGSTTTSERVKLTKSLASLQAQAEEVKKYEEKIHHLADQMIRLDLDDGVKHNYELFGDVLAKIK